MAHYCSRRHAAAVDRKLNASQLRHIPDGAVDHGASHKVVAVDTSIHHQSACDDGSVLACTGDFLREQGDFVRTRHSVHINGRCAFRAQLLDFSFEAIERA